MHKRYTVKDKVIAALSGMDLSIVRGGIFGVIGHSGAGKSTLVRRINLLAARADDQDSPAVKKLAAALQSPESKKFILERFKGNLVPAF